MTEELTAVGLGLDYHELRFGRTSRDWIELGEQLRDRVARTLGRSVLAVETVGSSSVLGLLAKPIIDLAAGYAADQDAARLVDSLEADGWIYRGDAGDNGGQVFVLEARPWYRVAHLHLVEHGSDQWTKYLRFRDLLRRDPAARAQYEAVKRQLAQEPTTNRRNYTAGKTDVVTALLRDHTELSDG